MTTAEGHASQSGRTTFGAMRDARQGALCALVTLTIGITAYFLAPLLLQGEQWEPYEVQATVGIAIMLIASSFVCDGLRAEKRKQRDSLR